MEIKQILEESRLIWGNKKCDLPMIVVRMGKVFGDICRYTRNERTSDRGAATEIQKELGNMIVSSTRWCEDLGYDPDECVRIALEAQKEYQKNKIQ